MTVKELIEALSLAPDNALVVMSSDEEGNHFSPLSDAEYGLHYLAESAWNGEIVEEPTDDSQEAVILWPLN